MTRYVFPAVFVPDELGYFVNFPDIDGCYTQGANLDEAKAMAADVLELILQDRAKYGERIPAPSSVADICVNDGEVVLLVACETIDYRLKEERRLRLPAIGRGSELVKF